MDSVEFGKKCKPYNILYRKVFGYVPCRADYKCSQEEYFDALLESLETRQEISAFVPKKKITVTLDKRD